MKNASIALLTFLVFLILDAQVHAGQARRDGEDVTSSANFELLTVGMTTMNGYSDYIQIRADGTVIQITANPELRPGDDVKAGRISKAALKAIEPALSAMLSPQLDNKSEIACQAAIPDAPINYITMVKGNKKYEWSASSCPTAQRWQALNAAVRSVVSGVLKPVP